MPYTNQAELHRALEIVDAPDFAAGLTGRQELALATVVKAARDLEQTVVENDHARQVLRHAQSLLAAQGMTKTRLWGRVHEFFAGNHVEPGTPIPDRPIWGPKKDK